MCSGCAVMFSGSSKHPLEICGHSLKVDQSARSCDLMFDPAASECRICEVLGILGG